MRKIFFVIFILLLFSPPSMGDTKEIKRISEITGIEWKILPKEFKVVFVTGWGAAGFLGGVYVETLNRQTIR